MKQEEATEIVKEMSGYLSQFKEMSHRAQSRIGKLAELSFVIEDKLEQKEFADRVTELFSISTKFEEKLERLIHDYEIERNRIENEAS